MGIFDSLRNLFGGQQNFNSTYEQDLSFPETRSWTGAQSSIEKANRVFSTKWYQNDSAVETGGPLKTYEQSKAPTSGPFSLDTYRGRTKDIAVYNEENAGRKNYVGTDFPSNNQRTNVNEKTAKQGTTAFSIIHDKNGNLLPGLKGSGEQQPNWFQKNRRFGDPEDQVNSEQQTNNSSRRKISEKQDVDLANQMHQGAIEARHAREIFQIKESSDEAADRTKKQILRNAKEEQRQQEIEKQQSVASNIDTSSSSNEVQEQSKPGLFSRIRDHFSPGKDDYGNYSDIKKAWKKSADSDDARIERFSSVAQSRKEAFEKANQEKYKDLKGSDREKKLFNDFIESERGMLQGNDKKYMKAYGSFLDDTKKQYEKVGEFGEKIDTRRKEFSENIKNIKNPKNIKVKDLAAQLGSLNTSHNKKGDLDTRQEDRQKRILNTYEERAQRAINEEKIKNNKKSLYDENGNLRNDISKEDKRAIKAKQKELMIDSMKRREERYSKINSGAMERQGRIANFESDAIAGHKVGNGHFKGKVGAVVGLLALGGIIGNQFAGGHQTNAQLYNPSPQPQYYS